MKVTNSSIAARLGVHWSTVSRWRNGSRVPSPATLNRMVEVYQLDPGEALAAYSRGPRAFSDYFCEAFCISRGEGAGQVVALAS